MAPEIRTFTDDQLRTTILEFLGAMNAHDVERALTFFTDDVVWEGSGVHAPAVGRAAVVEVLREWFSAFPDLHFPMEDVEIFRSLDGDRALVYWTSVGTMLGPYGDLAPTGRHSKVKGMCRYELREGGIARHTVLYDQLLLSQQLGLLPADGSVGYRALAGMQRLGRRLAQRRHHRDATPASHR
jgi:steroid delta-isomerase-like uncharacterized protein